MNKKTIIPTIVLTGVLTTSVISLPSGVKAEGVKNHATHRSQVRLGAQRESLSILDEALALKSAEAHDSFERNLDRLIYQGKLTSDQKWSIIDKNEEVVALLHKLYTMPEAEAQKELLTYMRNLLFWAKENNIKLDLLPGNIGL